MISERTTAGTINATVVCIFAMFIVNVVVVMGVGHNPGVLMLAEQIEIRRTVGNGFRVAMTANVAVEANYAVGIGHDQV